MKRKRISYAPMSDIEASRDDYLSNIYHKDDMSCLRMLRMRRAPFFLLCDTLKQKRASFWYYPMLRRGTSSNIPSHNWPL